MKVSIITATYNSSNSIISAINSVNGQTYGNIEHVFIDGNSSDNTLALIKNQSKRDNIIISEKDNGIYDALNKGIAHATGDIIGLVHSDDLLASNTIIEEVVNKIIKENLQGVYGDLIYINKTDETKVIRYWKSSEYQGKLLNKGWMPPHPTLFLKSEVYKNKGNFDIGFKIAADYDFILRIFSDVDIKLGYLPKVISRMRIGGESNRSLVNLFIKSKEDLVALRKNGIPRPERVLIRKNLSKIPQFLYKRNSI